MYNNSNSNCNEYLIIGIWYNNGSSSHNRYFYYQVAYAFISTDLEAFIIQVKNEKELKTKRLIMTNNDSLDKLNLWLMNNVCWVVYEKR